MGPPKHDRTGTGVCFFVQSMQPAQSISVYTTPFLRFWDWSIYHLTPSRRTVTYDMQVLWSAGGIYKVLQVCHSPTPKVWQTAIVLTSLGTSKRVP